jgi:hypothetical protein
MTEASTDDYLNRIVPLMIENKTVQNAFLAASASYTEVIHYRQRGTEIMRYRAQAFLGLHEISLKGFAEPENSVITLATILGLLIYDAISDSREHRALTQLVESWKRLAPSFNSRMNDPIVSFLLDQIQM